MRKKFDDLFDKLPVDDLFLPGRSVEKPALDQSGMLMQMSADHQVVDDRHPLEQGDILKRPGDPHLGALVGWQA